ncbi:MAG: HAD family hydrolase [Candidatus Micrarchaeota archaeon]|nr:HAD family hydrolase [Candidatus Micrarchaeota archaeon]
MAGEFDAVVFDIDGVLADSRKAVVLNTFLLMEEFGFRVSKKKIERLSTAHSAETVLITLVPSLKRKAGLLKKMLARLSELTRKNLRLIKPLFLVSKIPAISKQYKLGIATNRKASAYLVLEKFRISQYFSCVMTSADAPPKPSPKMLLLAAKKLVVRPQKTLFVGDNKEDAICAKKAGAQFFMLDGKDKKACQKLLRKLGIA